MALWEQRSRQFLSIRTCWEWNTKFFLTLLGRSEGKEKTEKSEQKHRLESKTLRASSPTFLRNTNGGRIFRQIPGLELPSHMRERLK